MSVTTGSELAVRTLPLVPENIEQAKALVLSSSLDELKELHGRASATEILARAKKNREAYMIAGEIKLWSERRVGEIRKSQPRRHGIQPRFDRDEARRLREQGLTQREIGERLGVDKSAIGYAERAGWSGGVPSQRIKDFDAEFGVASSVAYNWEKISEIPEDRFSQLIREAQEADGALTAAGILRREGRVYEKRIEPGMYLVRDGRISLRWQRDGVARMKILPHGDIVKARKELARVRGKIKETHVRVGYTVGDGYALVRRALQTLDRLEMADFHPDAKQAIAAAVGHLHKAEDELVGAANMVGRKRHASTQEKP